MPLVDFSRSDVKTWIFFDASDILEVDLDPNFGELKNFYHRVDCIQVTEENQL